MLVTNPAPRHDGDMAAAVAQNHVEGPTCWCCGSTFAEADLSRLGSHPEVAVCLRCAQWLYRRARADADGDSRTPGVLLRRTLAVARRRVMKAELQHWPVVGPLLRRLDRHLP